MHKIEERALKNFYKFFVPLIHEPICQSACVSNKILHFCYIRMGNHVHVKSSGLAPE